jgi:Fic family protein
MGELAGLGRAMPNPHLLIGPFLRREAVLSSRIEGAQADLADLYAYEAGQFSPAERRSGASEADVREVLNYVRALEYGLQRVAELPVSLRLLRELHERLLAGVRGNQATPGEFRRSQNWIGRPGCTLSDAEYVPPPAAEMHVALDLFERYLYADDGYPPLVRLAFIHYQFEAIHPFLDGNGRIGRLLISLLLVNWDLLSLPLLYLSAYFEQHRQEYYDLLLAVSQRSAWREWLAFFLAGIEEQARDANARAKRLQDLQLEWRRRLTQARASALLPRLADALFDSPVITIPQAQRILQVTYHSAQHNVEKLVEAGILTPHSGSATGKTFRAEDILHTTGEDTARELYF